MYLGENIRLLREAMKLSQESFGLILNVSRGQIHNYEKNINEPGVHGLLKLEELSGIPFRNLCKEKLKEEDFASISGDQGGRKILAVNEERAEYKVDLEGRLKRLEALVKKMEAFLQKKYGDFETFK